MRVVGVLDLMGGVAVHAIRGERDRYRPVEGLLADSAEPLAIAAGFHALGGEELYVADLDAIRGGALQTEAIAALAEDGPVMVDAGVKEAGRVRELAALGVARVVVGTETLGDAKALPAMGEQARIVLSLDLRERRVLARDPALAGRDALDAVDALADLAPDEIILLDLARVGTGGGPDVELIAAVHERLPEVALLAGGGVRDGADLHALERAGAAGALVGTALHTGAIGARDLR